MDSSNVLDKKGWRRINLSVGLTALAVIVLILLLALTIRHARETEMVGQFGLQQAAIAKGSAARLESRIALTERRLRRFAAEPEKWPGDAKRIQAVQEGLEGTISFLAATDERGTILAHHPPSVTGIKGGPLGEAPLFRLVRKTGKSAVGAIDLPDGAGGEGPVPAICVPRFRPDGEFGGAVLAAFSWTAFSDDTLHVAGGDTRIWLLDGQGAVLFHPRRAMIGGDLESLLPDRAEQIFLRGALLAGREGHGEYRVFGDDGRPEKVIVSHVPLRLPSGIGSFAFVTPYNRAAAPVRKTFLNIMVAAAGLILAVIIAAAAIIYAGRRRLYSREVQKRFLEREEWQEKLIREKKTIEGIIEGSPIPTFVLNRDHKIILWNRACTELTGYTAAEMIGTENQHIPFYSEKRPVIADLILEKDFESLEKFYGTKKVRKSATVPGAYEARDFYGDLGGKSRHLYFLAAPIHDEKGEIIAAIETLQDVSKEERMAIELREYAETIQNELQENIRLREEIESLYNYLQSIVDSLPDRLFVLSSDGTIHYMSRNVKEGIGMMAQQFKGKHFLEIVAPELRDLMKARWEDAQRGIFKPYEVSVRAKDGSKRTFLITPGPFLGSDRYVIVQRDVTELKNLEEKFYESQKMAAVGQLSAGIAHEVRNPLSSIKMSLQILEKRLNPTGNDLKRFRIAQREVEHLENLVNDVLIFAKPAAPRKETNDIRKIVEAALALADGAISEKRIEVQLRFDDDIPLMNLDAAMLEHAFLNLVLNAADAMEEGGLLKIAVREVPDGEGASFVEVEIEDDGCGIDAEDMRHLFNPFFTRKRTGTGLGLTQVKKIVELHRGSVDITSGKGEGTRVRVRLPRERTEVPSGSEAAAPGGKRDRAEEEGHGEDSRNR